MVGMGRSRRTPALVAVTGAALLGALLGGGGGAPLSAQLNEAPETQLKPCEIERGSSDALCGVYRVYEDRAAGRGRPLRSSHPSTAQ